MNRFTALQELWAKDTGVNTASISRFPLLPQLQVLSLPGTNLTGGRLAFLKNTPRLHTLFVGGTNLTDDDLTGLEHAKELRTLYIPTNPKITDAAVPLLSRIPTLRELNVDFTSISEAGRAQIRQARKDVKLVSLD